MKALGPRELGCPSALCWSRDSQHPTADGGPPFITSRPSRVSLPESSAALGVVSPADFSPHLCRRRHGGDTFTC
ncbi:hypothetical protein INR49_005828 [Caranx melampygus]|nr:hypothetical protein INR49_005828 [Caranx melampygus]